MRRARAPGKARSTPKLLAGLTIVALALANGLIAAGAYRFAADGLERQWGETVRDAVVKSRLWLTAAARTLSATGSAVAEAGDVGARCQSLLARALAEGAEFRGIRVDLSDGRVCARAVDATNAELVADAAVRLRAATKFDLAPGVALSLAGLAPPAASLLAVQIDAAPADASNARMTALVDPRLLAQAIELDRGESGIVALMSRDDQVVAASDLTSLDVDWLPATAAPIGPVFASLATASRGGGHFVYATQAILGDDLYVLGRLSDPARIPFLALAVAPVLLVLVCLAWASARRSDLMREVDAIKAAVLGRKAAKGVSLAPEGEQISPALRELAAAYNEMARESAAREQSLQVSLAENEHLLRELNHRVKSSLQIIQSYVSLTRRLDRQSGRQTGAAAIEARVHVLSIAYRKAFSEGRMRDVRLRQFAQEIVDSLARLFEHRDLELVVDAGVTAALPIDRAIPVGLALVECVIAGIDGQGGGNVLVRVKEFDDFVVELAISTDGAPQDHGSTNAKLLAGLALQAAATAAPAAPGTLLHWRLRGCRPPVLRPSDAAKAPAA